MHLDKKETELLLLELDMYRSMGSVHEISDNLKLLKRYQSIEDQIGYDLPDDLEELAGDLQLLKQYLDLGSINQFQDMFENVQILIDSYNQLRELLRDAQANSADKVYLQLQNTRAELQAYKFFITSFMRDVTTALRKRR
jgi:hypothetical protein